MSEMQTAAVIGGGFYGSLIAAHLRKHYQRVVLLEKSDDLLQRASYANQARVHNGYHYPRSLVTALRSRIDFSRFVQDFADCVESSFDKYYAIGRELSKVTARYFAEFCRRIEAPIQIAPEKVRRLFEKSLIEEVFRVNEYAFNAVALKDRCHRILEQSGVIVRLASEVQSVRRQHSGILELECTGTDGGVLWGVNEVFNCSYSQTNVVLANSGLPIIPLKHELAELALVEVPDEFRDKAVTVMCGPFFSCMPFPACNLHSLSHVRYTPHRAWLDREGECVDAHEQLRNDPKVSSFPHMIRDAQRYLPLLQECRHVKSLWEVKSVLPISEQDDSRPILFKKNWGLPGLHCVMGAKIDNIYDVLDEIDTYVLHRRCA